MTDKTTAEFEKFLTWFLDLEEISIYTRRDFLAHIIEVGGIDEKAAKFIDDTLAQLEEGLTQEINEFDHTTNTIQSLEDNVPVMEKQDIEQAEAEMQRIADKFCNEFREAQERENQEAEAEETETEKVLAANTRAAI